MNKLFCVVCSDKHGERSVRILTAPDLDAALAAADETLPPDRSKVEYGFFVCRTPDEDVFEET